MLFAWWPLLLLFLGIGKKKPASSPRESSPALPGAPAAPGTPALPPADAFVAAWKKRTTDLLPRSRQGAAWVTRMTALMGSPEGGAAASRWIGIESGGNAHSPTTSLSERGLAQVAKKSLAELGLTEADYAAMAALDTSDNRHALMAAKVIKGEIRLALKRAPVAALGWGPGAIGIGKLRHGLPLLLAELADQKIIQPSIAATCDAARVQFRPSKRLASFGGGKFAVTGKPVDDLLIRFLGSAAVVAHGDDAPNLFAPFKAPVS